MKELLLFGFLLTTALSSQASPEQEAYQAIALASYKQSGLEDVVQHEIDRNVSDDVKMVTGNVFLIVNTIREQKLSYTWRF